MGKMEVDGIDDIDSFFNVLKQKSDGIVKASMYEGASQIADAMRLEIESLPTEPMRYLRDGDMFNVFTDTNKRDLLEGLGIAKFKEKDGAWGTYIGFTGYGSVATKKYPKGIPNALVARSINSGSSVRRKNRFAARVRNKAMEPALRATKEKALELIKQLEG